jgi:surfactin synthase thioesterase subunit
LPRRITGHDGAEAPLASVEALAARILQEVRVVQPHGPYLIGGHSFGGIVAYEMARQLLAAGQQVARHPLRLPSIGPQSDLLGNRRYTRPRRIGCDLSHDT